MKRIVLFVSCIAVAVGMSSCEKTYTCTCVYPGQSVGTTETSIKAKKRSEAEAVCNNQNQAAKLSGGSCAL